MRTIVTPTSDFTPKMGGYFYGWREEPGRTSFSALLPGGIVVLSLSLTDESFRLARHPAIRPEISGAHLRGRDRRRDRGFAKFREHPARPGRAALTQHQGHPRARRQH